MDYDEKRIVYRLHALKRMIEREISMEEVESATISGETIENYPNQQPYPCRLILGSSKRRPIHVVVADNIPGNETIVVTVYEPDVEQWSNEFRKRI